jgi:hypothetical protein
MTEAKDQPDCTLAELIAAALGAARAASIALDAVVDVVDHELLITRVQEILAGPRLPLEEELDAIRELADLLLEVADAERWWWLPENAETPIEELTPVGRQIQDACRALREARITAARAIDRSRAEELVAERPR